jgi:hypothetical protein
MTTIRRLAAILAADVAGYSRLMGGGRESSSEGRPRMLYSDLQLGSRPIDSN